MIEASATEVSGTVTRGNPLAVVVDGATLSTTADRLVGLGDLGVGDRVQVQDRSPRRPLVVGKVEPEAAPEPEPEPEIEPEPEPEIVQEV